MDKSIEFEKRSQDYLKTDRIHPKVAMSLYTGTQLQNGVNSAISRQHDLHAQDSFVRKVANSESRGLGRGVTLHIGEKAIARIGRGFARTCVPKWIHTASF